MLGCLFMNPILYQVEHPWHWLTYGNNAVAVQTVIAGLALIGVVAYTALTRSMRNANLAQLRAHSRPILHMELTGHGTDDAVEVSVKNIGSGPATMIVYEIGGVSADQVLLGRLMAFRPERKDIFEESVFSAAPPNSKFTFSAKKPATGDRLMILLFYRDLSLNRFQTQFLISNRQDGLVGVVSYAEPKHQPDPHPQTGSPQKVKEPVML
jgi:hypothetical protein